MLICGSSSSSRILSLAVAAMAMAAGHAFVVVPSNTAAVARSSRSDVVAVAATETTQMQDNDVVDAVEEEDTNPRLSGLAFALDDGTRKSHSMAENTAFVQGFFKGISSPDSYRNLLTSLYYVYQAMEEGVLDHAASDSMVSTIDEAPLRRLAGLEKDMEYFYGADWRTSMAPPTPATKTYVDRILEITTTPATPTDSETTGDDDQAAPSSSTSSSSSQYLFVAHQYTRYLGDLFGGQMMGNMAARSMDLPSDGSGVAFYTFEGVDSVRDFITDWYTALNALDLTPRQKQDIVDEANLVFALNIGLFEELEGSPWAALWTMAKSSARDFTTWANIKESKNVQQ